MRLGVLVAAVATALAPAKAMAMGAVVGQEGEAVAFRAARVAVAMAPGRTSLWAQVSVSGASAGFVWIVPVRPGARIDLASDAWLDALDAATSPVVLPPAAAPAVACDTGVAPALVPPATSPQSSRPTATGVFTDSAALGAFVASAGCALPASVASAVDALLSAGVAVFASTYASAALPARTIRIVDTGLPVLPAALTGTSAWDAQVTAFVIASDAVAAGASPLTLDPSSVRWGGDAASTYLSARQALLEQWRGSRWLTESAMPGLLFDGAPIGPGQALPSVVEGYFTLATAYGDATGDAGACAAAARAPGGDAGSYTDLCPAGALGAVAGTSPCSPPQDGGEPVDTLTCGSSLDDAALAVASLVASDVWITRIEGIVERGSSVDVPLSLQPATPSSPVVTAGGYEAPCAVTPAPVPTTLPPLWTPPTSVGLPPPSTAPPAETTVTTSPEVGTAAEGCGAVADACASSNSGDSSNDGCGSGSSTGGGTEGGDSTADSGSGGCGGSDSSGSGGCAAAGRRRVPSRSPASRLLLAAAAIFAVVRRRRRRSLRDRHEPRGRESPEHVRQPEHVAGDRLSGEQVLEGPAPR